MKNIFESKSGLWVLVLAAGIGFAGCAKQEADHDAVSDAHDVHWTYEGESGPAAWGAINPEWAACSEGVQQSPINLTGADLSDLADPVLSYQPVALQLLNNGHTVQAAIAAGNTLEVDGVTYEMLQFHLHSPSEHSVDGALTPLEIHFVHQSQDGVLAVLGVMVQEGAFNPAYEAVMSSLPASEGETVAPEGVLIDITGLLPAERTTYRYQGSLTTPPCSEGVQWMVLTTPVEMSAEQIAAFSALYPVSNRPVQPLNERTLIRDAS
jgi:carbonic anhydrase